MKWIPVMIFHIICFIVGTGIFISLFRTTLFIHLGYVNTHDQRPVSSEELTDAVIETYLTKHMGMRKRIDEHLATGIIRKEKGGIQHNATGSLSFATLFFYY